MNMNNMMVEMIFVFSSFMFFAVKTHFLMSMMFMEMISLSLFFMMISSSYSSESSTMILFLCVMVLEGVLGLSLIVKNSRKSGGDFLMFY